MKWYLELKFPQQQCRGRCISAPVRNYQDSYFHFHKNTSVQNVEYPQLTTLQAYFPKLVKIFALVKVNKYC